MKRYKTKLSINLFFLLAYSCSNSINSKNNVNIGSIDMIQEKNRSSIIIKNDSKNVFTEISIAALNVDNVLSDVKIINKSNIDLFIKKSLIPDTNFLNESVFSIFLVGKEAEGPLDLKSEWKKRFNWNNKLDTNIVYNQDQFYKIESNSKHHFKLNLANFYQFKKGVKYSILYSAYTPIVKKNEQVFEIDTFDNKRKPIYFLLSTKNANSDTYIDDKCYFEIIK